MRIIFTAYAVREMKEAVRYYNEVYPGLGKEFKDEVNRAVCRIAEYPEAWSIERGEVRRCPLHRFSYKLLYAIESDHIVVTAVAHQHRKPDYWIDRDG
jgi:plasmid stabilization system protein ParE